MLPISFTSLTSTHCALEFKFHLKWSFPEIALASHSKRKQKRRAITAFFFPSVIRKEVKKRSALKPHIRTSFFVCLSENTTWHSSLTITIFNKRGDERASHSDARWSVKNHRIQMLSVFSLWRSVTLQHEAFPHRSSYGLHIYMGCSRGPAAANEKGEREQKVSGSEYCILCCS